MKDVKVVREIAKSSQNSVKKLDDLITALKRAGMNQDTIEKAVAMKNKYQDIANYNKELAEDMDL